MDTSKPVTPERVMQFAWGYAPTLIIEAALRHKIFDLLDAGPKTVAQLASETGASPRGLKAILNALVSLQFLATNGGRYSLTPESATFLVSTKPAFYGEMFKHISADLLPKWMQLTEVVKTGKPAMAVNEHKEGAEFFAGFVEALFPLGYHAAKLLGQHLNVAKSSSRFNLLDLAAGSGVWGIGVAEQSPNVHITAVDWPEVLQVTRRVAQRHGLGDRLKTIAGDLLNVEFGTGYHLATLGHILHSEGVERSRQLLRKTFASLASGGTIGIMEFVPNDERTGPPQALIFAVNMLVNTEAGDTFTFAEMSEWLREAGFVNPHQLDVQAVSPLILATKP
jgi:ubiquinone/menaquinone biosynthesis C-methylase UbiE